MFVGDGFFTSFVHVFFFFIYGSLWLVHGHGHGQSSIVGWSLYFFSIFFSSSSGAGGGGMFFCAGGCVGGCICGLGLYVAEYQNSGSQVLTRVSSEYTTPEHTTPLHQT